MNVVWLFYSCGKRKVMEKGRSSENKSIKNANGVNRKFLYGGDLRTLIIYCDIFFVWG